MRFVLFVIHDAANLATQDEMDGINIFNEWLQKENRMVMAAGIAAPDRATVIDNRTTRLTQPSSMTNVTPSSIQADVFYAGFWVIDADSEQHALDIARAGSAACNRQVEVRPFLGSS